MLKGRRATIADLNKYHKAVSWLQRNANTRSYKKSKKYKNIKDVALQNLCKT